MDMDGWGCVWLSGRKEATHISKWTMNAIKKYYKQKNTTKVCKFISESPKHHQDYNLFEFLSMW